MPKNTETEAESAAVDYTTYASKAPTDLQSRFAEWIVEKVEIDPATFKTKQQAFEEGVRLAVALRIPFQASPENQAVRAEAARAREAAASEAAPAPAKPAKAAPVKATKAAAAKAQPARTEVSEAAAAAPKGTARRGRKATAASTAAF